MKPCCSHSVNDNFLAGEICVGLRSVHISPLCAGLGGTFAWAGLAKPYKAIPCADARSKGWGRPTAQHPHPSCPWCCWALWGLVHTHTGTYTHRARAWKAQAGGTSCSFPSALACVGFACSWPSPSPVLLPSKQPCPPPAPSRHWPWPESHNPLQPQAIAESGRSPRDTFCSSTAGHSPLWGSCLWRKTACHPLSQPLGSFTCPVVSASSVWCTSHQCQST